MDLTQLSLSIKVFEFEFSPLCLSVRLSLLLPLSASVLKSLCPGKVKTQVLKQTGQKRCFLVEEQYNFEKKIFVQIE